MTVLEKAHEEEKEEAREVIQEENVMFREEEVETVTWEEEEKEARELIEEEKKDVEAVNWEEEKSKETREEIWDTLRADEMWIKTCGAPGICYWTDYYWMMVEEKCEFVQLLEKVSCSKSNSETEATRAPMRMKKRKRKSVISLGEL